MELAFPVDPDVAKDPQNPPAPPELVALGQFLRHFHARLEPSVAPKRAKRLGLLKFYTIRFKPAALSTLGPGLDRTARLVEFTRRLKRLGPSIIVNAAPVPSPSPPTDDPMLGTSSVVSYGGGECGTQWYIQATGVDAAWACGATGKGVAVADIDWGFDMAQLDVAPAFDPAHTYDACSADARLRVDARASHGTASAGIIAARKNDFGIRGIAYEAKLWAMQASCTDGIRSACDSWERSDVNNPWADAIAKAVGDSCDGCRKVILLETETCCGGNYEASIAVHGAIVAAVAANIVVVVAAGNGSRDALRDDLGSYIQPTGSILVGATEYGPSHTLHSTSNYGDGVIVYAPGADDIDLTCGTRYDKCDSAQADNQSYTSNFGGTSGASAKVAGVVALLLQKNPELDVQGVKAALMTSTVTVTGPGTTTQPGVFLDAAAAVAAVTPGGCP